MPKVGGKNIDECMEMCMSDEKFKNEESDAAKRRSVCYAACQNNFEDRNIEELIGAYKDAK